MRSLSARWITGVCLLLTFLVACSPKWTKTEKGQPVKESYRLKDKYINTTNIVDTNAVYITSEKYFWVPESNNGLNMLFGGNNEESDDKTFPMYTPMRFFGNGVCLRMIRQKEVFTDKELNINDRDQW